MSNQNFTPSENSTFYNCNTDSIPVISFNISLLSNDISLLSNEILLTCARDILEWHINGELAPNATFGEFCKWYNDTHDCHYSRDIFRLLIFEEIIRRKINENILLDPQKLKQGMLVWYSDEEVVEKGIITEIVFTKDNELKGFFVEFGPDDIDYFTQKSINTIIFFNEETAKTITKQLS